MQSRGKIPRVIQLKDSLYKFTCPVALVVLTDDQVEYGYARYDQLCFGRTHVYYTELKDRPLEEIVLAQDWRLVHGAESDRFRYGVFLDGHVAKVIPDPPAAAPPDEEEGSARRSSSR